VQRVDHGCVEVTSRERVRLVRSLTLALVVSVSSLVHADVPKSPSRAAAKKASAIDIKALTVRFNGDPIAHLFANGTSDSVGDSKPGKGAKFSPGPTFHADGTIDLKAGYKVRVEAEGDVFLRMAQSNEERKLGHIDDKKLVVMSSDMPLVNMHVDGAKLFTDDNAQSTLLGEVDPPKAGRTAMLMAMALYIEMGIAAR
jgi:hypothetical protein